MAVVGLTTGVVLKRGFRRRCAVCGQKKLFRRWVIMVEQCPRCSFRFQREPGQWLGSWFLNICLAQLVVVGILVAGVVAGSPRPPILALSIAAGLAACLFPIWFFPYSRTIWVAIDLAMRPLEFSEGVDPFWELEGERRLMLRDQPSSKHSSTAGRQDEPGRFPPVEPDPEAGGPLC
jgi:uncharacterized protein (DUF983 family)